ncbi:MAG TPA: AroM family protein [Actinocatenispora sp.]
MSSRTLGVVTIGQSPRVDMVPEMLPWLGLTPDSVVERGALDGLSASGISALAPTRRTEHVLTTRLADGSSVVLDHDAAVDRVQYAISELEPSVDATLVVCTGEFPLLTHNKPLLFAERLLLGGAAALCEHEPVGVICPLAAQVRMSHDKWRPVVGPVVVAAATPYEDGAADSVAAAAKQLAGVGATRIVLDCMGYTDEMRRAAADAAGVPVLLARGLVARLAGELVA